MGNYPHLRAHIVLAILAFAAIAFLAYIPYRGEKSAEAPAARQVVVKTVEERAETLAGLREYAVSVASSTLEEARMESLGKLRELASNAPPQTIEEREARLRAMRDALRR